MEWKSWLSGIRFTLLFVVIMAVVVTVTAVLTEIGLIEPSYWEVSASQWWGIFTSHFLNRGLEHYVGNMGGLLVFTGVFIFASAALDTSHARKMRGKLDVRLPWIILGSAFLVMLLMWSIYVIAGMGSGMGTSAVVSGAFGAGTGLYLAMAMDQKTTPSVPREAEDGVRKRLMARTLFFMGLFVAFYLPLYGLLLPPAELVVHWLSYLIALFLVMLRF